MGIDMPAALVILGVLGTICTGIVRWPWRQNGTTGKYVCKDVCNTTHAGLSGLMHRLEKDIAEVKADVKNLLKHSET